MSKGMAKKIVGIVVSSARQHTGQRVFEIARRHSFGPAYHRSLKAMVFSLFWGNLSIFHPNADPGRIETASRLVVHHT